MSSPGCCCSAEPGPVNDAIHFLVGPAQAIDVYSIWGMALIEGVGFVPLTFLLMSAVLRSMDASFEEAAIMAGASPLRAFWSVTLRMGTPALCALALLFFAQSLRIVRGASLGRARRQHQCADDDDLSRPCIAPECQATARPAPIRSAWSVVVALLLFWQNRLSRHAHRYQTITGKGFRPRIVDLGSLAIRRAPRS